MDGWMDGYFWICVQTHRKRLYKTVFYSSSSFSILCLVLGCYFIQFYQIVDNCRNKEKTIMMMKSSLLYFILFYFIVCLVLFYFPIFPSPSSLIQADRFSPPPPLKVFHSSLIKTHLLVIVICYMLTYVYTMMTTNQPSSTVRWKLDKKKRKKKRKDRRKEGGNLKWKMTCLPPVFTISS